MLYSLPFIILVPGNICIYTHKILSFSHSHCYLHLYISVCRVILWLNILVYNYNINERRRFRCLSIISWFIKGTNIIFQMIFFLFFWSSIDLFLCMICNIIDIAILYQNTQSKRQVFQSIPCYFLHKIFLECVDIENETNKIRNSSQSINKNNKGNDICWYTFKSWMI